MPPSKVRPIGARGLRLTASITASITFICGTISCLSQPRSHLRVAGVSNCAIGTRRAPGFAHLSLASAAGAL